jgi:hypothetical protein
MEVGTIFRDKNDVIRVVAEVMYVEGNTKLNRPSEWKHLVRAPTEEERLLSDILQT